MKLTGRETADRGEAAAATLILYALPAKGCARRGASAGWDQI
jgi:hypothetical protein